MKTLDIALTVGAAVTFYYNWGTKSPITQNLVAGVQGFAAANLIDRIARITLPEHAAAPAPLVQGIQNAVIEEVLYAGCLQTTAKKWIPIRFPVSLILGMTATGNNLKISLLWSGAREALLLTLPESYSTSLLTVSDSLLFSLGHLKEVPPEAIAYRAISCMAFRAIANFAAQKTSIGASLTQHILFNISRSNCLTK